MQPSVIPFSGEILGGFSFFIDLSACEKSKNSGIYKATKEYSIYNIILF